MSGQRPELGPSSRILAALFAAAWIGAALAALGLGLRAHRWVLVALSPVALLYGWLWVEVARTGRRLRWPGKRGSR